MNELKDLVIMKDGRAVTSSLEAAKIFDKRHDHVMRDINNLKKDVPNFGEMFFEAETTDSYGRKQKINYMNRDGFSLLVMGYTGKKAMEFKLKYIEAFNKMEAYIREQEAAKQLPQTPEERLKLTIEATVHLDERLTSAEKDIKEIKNKSEIDSAQRYKLLKTRNKRAMKVCGGEKSNYYKDTKKRRHVYQALAHDLKEYFQIPRYDALRKEDFDKAIEFINGWYPSVLLKRDIDRINAQTDLDI